MFGSHPSEGVCQVFRATADDSDDSKARRSRAGIMDTTSIMDSHRGWALPGFLSCATSYTPGQAATGSR